jgi:hypothetical protein
MWNQHEVNLLSKVLYNFPFVKSLNMLSILKMKGTKINKNNKNVLYDLTNLNLDRFLFFFLKKKNESDTIKAHCPRDVL